MADSVGQAQNIQVPNYSGVNIQIFNPSVAAPGTTVPVSNINAPSYNTTPSYPGNYYTQNFATPPAQPQAKKTEKRDIIQLSDDYIKNLEDHLNSQDKQIRLMGAKEVLARFQEDDSRKHDPALNALVNKMLQDPSQSVKFIAMAALESGAAAGNGTTVSLLHNLEQKNTCYGEDSRKASGILLKMSGNTVQKEFEVKDKSEKS